MMDTSAEGAGERLERERPQKEWEKEWKEKDRQKEQGKRLRGRRGEDSGWSGGSDGNG